MPDFPAGIYQNRSDGTIYKFFYQELKKPTRTVLMAKCLTGIKQNLEAFAIADGQMKRASMAQTWKPYETETLSD